MKQRVEKYLPFALEAVTETKIAEGNPLSVSNEYKGYISSFGAAIIQTGLIPAVAFYSVKARAEKDRNKIPKAILHILKKSDEINENVDDLLKYLVDHYDADLSQIKSKIMDATTALKLAIRTFPITKNKKDESNEN